MSFYQDRYIKMDEKSSVGLFYIMNKSEQLMSKSVNTQSLPNGFGDKVKSIKYNSKIIKYSIMFTMEQLKNAEVTSIHDLKRLVAGFFDSEEEVKLWDSRDPNIYCNVVYQGTSEITFLGNHTATTEVELLIPSGLHFSTVEKEFTASLNSDGELEATVVSKGTAKSNITIEAKMKDENGYFAVVSTEGVIELGNRNEADGVIAEKSVVLTSNKNGDFSNWTDATVFAENASKKAVTTMGMDSQFGGRLGILQNGFTNTANSNYFGAMKEFTIENPAQNFYLWAQAWFETGLMGQTGMWTLTIANESNKEIASMHIYKTDTTGNQAKITFSADGKHLKTIDFTPYYWQKNPYGSESRLAGRNPFDIKKEGSKIRFFYCGSYFNYTVPSIADMKAKKVQFFVGQYKGRNATNQLVTRMSLNNLSFIDTKVSYWKDVPNRYAKGDILRISGEERTPYVNELPRFEDQLKGTEYFKLPEGTNSLLFYQSPFSPAPEIKVYLREAFI